MEIVKPAQIFSGIIAFLLTVNFAYGRAAVLGPGVLDDSFAAGPFYEEISYLVPFGKVLGLALGPNDEVYIGGHFSMIGWKRWNGLARLKPDGSLDESFAVPVFSLTNQNHIDAHDIVVTEDGVLAGFNSLKKYLLNGSEDRTFSPVQAPSISRLVLRNGKQLVFYESVLVRLFKDGTVDPDYEQPQLGAGAGITAAMIERANGQVYVAGTFSKVNGKDFPSLVRLNEDGTLDENFRADSKLITGTTNARSIFALALQPHGKVLVAGSFSSGEPAVSGNIVRLNANGTLDTSFDVGSGAKEGNHEAPGTEYPNPPKISRIAVQKDGKILVAGDFRRFSGFLRDGVARLRGDPVHPLEVVSFRTISANRGVLEVRGTADVVEVEATAELASAWHSVMVGIVTNEISTTIEISIDPNGAKFFRVKRR